MEGSKHNNGLRFKAEDYVCRLPVSYYLGGVSLQSDPRLVNYEVTALPDEERYILKLIFRKACFCNIRLRLGNGSFFSLPVKNGTAETEVQLQFHMLAFDLEYEDSEETDELQEFQLIPSCFSGKLEDFTLYRRDTCIEKCNLAFGNWEKEYQAIINESFQPSELTAMSEELCSWCVSRQVTDPENPHYGAIYSEEDKYCFKDAIFAALIFYRHYKRTGDAGWLKRAEAARNYCYKGQYRNTGNPAKDGCWAAMGIIDDKAGRDFRRITAPWAQASGVDTAIIAIQSERLMGLGMKFTDEMLQQLREAVAWNMNNMVSPGWFSHHEGMTLLCINMNGLGAAMFYAVHGMLVMSGKDGLSAEELSAADLGFRNVIGSQESIGVYPYRPFSFQRGGAYSLSNVPDNGMTLQAICHLLNNPYSPFKIKEYAENMRKSALWYLLTSRRDADGHLVLDYRMEPAFFETLAFGNFTWCRVMMLEVISQFLDSIGNREFWRKFCLAHARTIRETLWQKGNDEHAPLVRSVGPVRLVSWIQQAEWAACVFDDLAERLSEKRV